MLKPLLTFLLALVAVIAPSAPTAPFFFIQLSDPQFGMYTSDKEFAQETTNFEFAIATANRLRPAFVVVTGDLVNKPGDPAQIAEYRRIAGKLHASIPRYDVAGNHDVENVPTMASVAAYRKIFGPDHYSFTSGPVTGIVLNSSLIHSPQGAPELAAEQLTWLKAELARVGAAASAFSGDAPSARSRVIVFQHHPWFLGEAGEADQYFNIPIARRVVYLDLFRQFGVHHLFSGHYHRNAEGRDGDIHMVTTGPVGKPINGKSGLRVVIVRADRLEHRFYEFGDLPNRIVLDGLR